MLFHTKRAFNKQQGFTLIEILLVMAIVGIMALVIVVSMSTSSPEQEELQTAHKQFIHKLRYAREQAVMRQWVLGIQFDEHSYRFVVWQHGRWQVLTQPPLQVVQLERIRLEWELGEFGLMANQAQATGLTFDLGAKKLGVRSEEEKLLEPQVILYESAEFTPFTLYWYEQDTEALLVELDASSGYSIEVNEGSIW